MEQITKTTFKELCEGCFKEFTKDNYIHQINCPNCIYKNNCMLSFKELCIMNNTFISPCEDCKYKKICLSLFKKFLKYNQENITNELLYDLSSFTPISFVNKNGKFLFNEEIGNEILELKEE